MSEFKRFLISLEMTKYLILSSKGIPNLKFQESKIPVSFLKTGIFDFDKYLVMRTNPVYVSRYVD